MSQNYDFCALNHVHFLPLRLLKKYGRHFFFKLQNKWTWEYARSSSVATFIAVIFLPLLCILNFWVTLVYENYGPFNRWKRCHTVSKWQKTRTQTHFAISWQTWILKHAAVPNLNSAFIGDINMSWPVVGTLRYFVSLLKFTYCLFNKHLIIVLPSTFRSHKTFHNMQIICPSF
jgi:hypothetical protein